MMISTRRAIVAATALAAGGTVAAAWLLRKPAPVIHAPIAAAQGATGGNERVPLQGASALVATDPPHPVAPISFTDARGATHRIGELAGRGVVVNLWATWCVPCVAELPALARLAAQVAGDGIVVLPLSSDRGGAAAVERFFHGHAIVGLDIMLDPGGAAGEALAARGVPTTVIVDRVGRERARLEGAADWAAPAMVAAIRRLVG
jgi:thiol-disulfide isomerase/thioredoxin